MRTFETVLSSDGLENLAKELDDYRKSLKTKMKLMLDKLAERGISVATEKVAGGTHTMPQRIVFYTEVKSEGNTYTVYVVGKGTPFPSNWIDSDGFTWRDMVYPMSMMEFGSGAYAVPETYDFGGYGGQGTFSRRGNEERTSWWFVREPEDGKNPNEAGAKTRKNARRGTAIKPTRPLYHAAKQMQSDVESIAREVFGGG